MLSCQNTANTTVFGWFALGAGGTKSKENTRAFTIHFKLLVETTSQKKNMFSAFAKKKSVNSSVLDDFRP